MTSKLFYVSEAPIFFLVTVHPIFLFTCINSISILFFSCRRGVFRLVLVMSEESVVYKYCIQRKGRTEQDWEYFPVHWKDITNRIISCGAGIIDIKFVNARYSCVLLLSNLIINVEHVAGLANTVFQVFGVTSEVTRGLNQGSKLSWRRPVGRRLGIQ